MRTVGENDDPLDDATGDAGGDDGYRERYRQLVQEFDAAETDWQRDRAAGMRLLANMVLKLSATQPELSGLLKSFGDALQAGRFEAETETLSSLIDDLLAEVAPGPDLDSLGSAIGRLEALLDVMPSDPDALTDSAGIGRVLAKLEAALGERLQMLQRDLRVLANTLYEVPGWPDALAAERDRQRNQFAGRQLVDVDALADLIERGFSSIDQERGEICRFLGDLVGRLDVLEKTFSERDSRRRDLLIQAGEVNRHIETSVKDLLSESQVATDIDSLRTAIDRRLHSLTDDLLTLRGLGEDAISQSDQAAQELLGRLRSLEAERDQLSRSLAQTHREARIDMLTALPNRRALDERLEEEEARAGRQGEVFSVALVDIDHFKQINDRFGHTSGDRALQIIAKLLRTKLRRADVLGRWGGEEFLILFPATVLESAREIAERVRLGLSNAPTHFKGEQVRLTASFGLAAWDGQSDTIPALVERADKSLYEAKQAGRDTLRG
ncbi:hypothetical protein BI364_04270 [Acidihalobacter yilgarnensis]|uniref:diguanylate cyclase n=1 Tax=Acidihalobacter yilgarnensis TaxID=2819280 RepID=A0A1D8ILH8_9GAMM|nr:GGDEF domain-containing protein [Acidihalobacter yilgarnensis]AOU97312.1 hypothetical protein BI364_04270 [Acidihalobacter yilgarnensis]